MGQKLKHAPFHSGIELRTHDPKVVSSNPVWASLVPGCKEIERSGVTDCPTSIGFYGIKSMTLIRVDDMYNVSPLSWIGIRTFLH